MELTIDQALQLAVEAHKAGKLQDAEALYRAILQSQPKHPDANHNLGVLAVSVNRADVALPLFKNAIDANPRQGQFWISYIDALIKEKQFDNARNLLSQAKKSGLVGERLDELEAKLTVSLLAQSSEASANKVATFTQQRKKVSAKQEKKKNSSSNQTSLNQAQNPSEVELNALLEHYQKGRYDLAENLAKTITQKYPDHQFGWKVIGAVFRQTGRLHESLNANQRAVAVSPNDAEAHYNLGNTLKELGRLDDAETSFKKAIAIKPGLAEAHSNLGNTLQELGRLEDAETSFKKAIAIKPGYAEAHNNLGNTLQELGKLEDAETSYKKAIALKPDYTEAFSNLSSTLLYLDKLNDATQVLLKIIEIDPEGDGLKACVGLAILNFLNGNRSSSKSFLLKSTKILNNKKPGLKNDVAYWNYLSKLLANQQNEIQKKIDNLEIQKLYVIGESHTLSSHETYIKTSQGHYLCQSFWIIGCKQWHLGNTLENKYKYKLKKIIQCIPSYSNILLSIGEIDCRIDGGILNHIKKYPVKDKSELINSTINDYLKYISKLLTPFSCNVTIQGVPCPNISVDNKNKDDISNLIELLKEFNVILKKQSHFYGFNFLDLHKLTDRGDGFSNGKWHIDQHHLSPAGMQEAWLTCFIPYSV